MITDEVKTKIGAVVIGRNEGARLIVCINSLITTVEHIVYVDSGSTDNSVKAAESLGVTVLSLDMSIPFTAARARNEGALFLCQLMTEIEYIQFVDGDCQVTAGWIEAAYLFLNSHIDYAVACGRRRERFPEHSIYNQLCDIEWDTPVGDALACGGDALMRVKSYHGVSGYNNSLIAGEEPELCYRLRNKGWKVKRLENNMTLHDAAITELKQWWNRAKRSGYAYACSYALHGKEQEKFKEKETFSIVFWAGVIPMTIIALSFVKPPLLLLLLIYPIQVIRIALKQDRIKNKKLALSYGFFTVFAKFPQFSGVLKFVKNLFTGEKARLIEYK